MKKYKPIYFSLEVMTRELPSRILLALIAAKRGYISIIGHKIDMVSNLHVFRQGFYWHKSLTDVCHHYYLAARNFGNINIGCCEETLNIAESKETDAIIANTLSNKTLGLIDHYFACNSSETKYAKPYVSGKFYNTGNVRFDIIRDEFFPVYAKAASKIKKDYGDFVLMNSTIFYLHSFRDIVDEIKVAADVNETSDFILSLRNGEVLVRDRMLELCKRIPKETGLSVVFRPHPHENVEKWRPLLDGLDGVHIDTSLVLPPLIMASKAVLHGHCTTGVEAIVQGRQGFNFAPSANPYYLINTLRPPMTTSEIIECLAHDRFVETAEPISKYIFGVEGPLASQRIVDELDKIDAPSWSLNEIIDRPFVIRDYDDMDASMQNRWPKMEIDRVNSIIQSFAPVVGKFGLRLICAKKLTDNMVALYPSD